MLRTPAHYYSFLKIVVVLFNRLISYSFFVRVGNINDLVIVEIRKKSNANSLIRNINFAYLYLQFGASGRLVGGNRLIR